MSTGKRTDNGDKNTKKRRKLNLKKLNVKRFLIVTVSAIFIIYCIWVFIWQQVTISHKNSEIDELQAQIDAATEENERLNTELENVNDPENIERMAREKLGLVRPNERVFTDANQGD